MESSKTCNLQQQLLAVALVLAACSGVVSESTTARRQLAAGRTTTSWQSYWDAHFPGVPAPPSLARLSSQLSAAETANYVQKLQSGQVWATDDSLCKEGPFLCAAHPNGGCEISFSYSYGCGGGGAASTHMLSGVFFRPDKLSAGNTIVYPNQLLDNDLQGRTFLPAELAKAMPFTPAKLPSYLALLGVPSGSNMAANMEDTMAFCNSKALPGEIFACHSSIESMVQFSLTNIGPKVAMLSPAAYGSTASQEVRVVRQPVTLSPADQKSISCHDRMFPYLVYGCHVMESSIIQDVELQRADGSSFHGISVCHTDTTSWNPAHPAFAALNAKPGDGTLCHWVPHNNFLWIHA